MRTFGKCSVCNQNSREKECPPCQNQVNDLAFVREWTYERAVTFLKADKSAMVQRHIAAEVSRQKFIVRHSRPITSSQMVFAPNKTVSQFQLKLRRA